jgi:pimeloyl-ACP methyl ester carboxylesterase
MKRLAHVLMLTLLLGVLAALVAAAIAGLSYQPNTGIAGGKHITVNGVSIHYTQQGQGSDVLLVHGSTGSVEDWQPLLAALAKTHRVTAFDRPGHGFSGDMRDHSQLANARIVRALINALKLRDVLLVGHSYGGAVVLLTAANAPALVHGVVVIDSAFYAPVRKVELRHWWMSIPVIGQGFLRLLPDALCHKKVREGLVREFREKPPAEPFLRQSAQIWCSPKVLHSLAEEAIGSIQWLPAVSHLYKSIKRPVYVLAQAEEPARVEQARQLHADIPGAKLFLVPHTGHFVHHEQPEQVLQVIREAAQ